MIPKDVEKTVEKLLTVFTPEQLEQLANVAAETKDEAMTRRCSESFSVEINDKGYPRYAHYQRSLEFAKPVMYKPE